MEVSTTCRACYGNVYRTDSETGSDGGNECNADGRYSDT